MPEETEYLSEMNDTFVEIEMEHLKKKLDSGKATITNVPAKLVKQTEEIRRFGQCNLLTKRHHTCVAKVASHFSHSFYIPVLIIYLRCMLFFTKFKNL